MTYSSTEVSMQRPPSPKMVKEKVHTELPDKISELSV